jgi:hypothetical protein
MKLWWWITDRIEYGITSMKLAIFDKIRGSEPLTSADRQREHERQRLQEAFRGVDIDRKKPRP